jgi:hypothetical protein
MGVPSKHQCEIGNLRGVKSQRTVCCLRDIRSWTLPTSINHVSAVCGVQLCDIACDADLRTDVVVTSDFSPTPGVVSR